MLERRRRALVASGLRLCPGDDELNRNASAARAMTCICRFWGE